MNNEKARRILSEVSVMVLEGDPQEYMQAMEVAISALTERTTEDITAEEAIELLGEHCDQFDYECRGCELNFSKDRDLCILDISGNAEKAVEILKKFKKEKEEAEMDPVQRAIEFAEELIGRWDRNGDITDTDMSHMIEILKGRE